MKATTLDVLSLDVAIYCTLSLPNHTIIPKLKREGESKEKQECRVGGNRLIGKQLAY